MKMISSTSTTSTSGVTLISDCRPVPLALTCMISLSFGLGAFVPGDQPHAAEAGPLDREHRLADGDDVEPGVPLAHDLGVRLAARRGAELFVEMLGFDLTVVDPQPSTFVDRYQDPAPLVALLARLRRLRQVDVRTLPHLRRHHHEDDQQYEHHVDERRDVDVRLHPGRLSELHGPLAEPSAPPPGWRTPSYSRMPAETTCATWQCGCFRAASITSCIWPPWRSFPNMGLNVCDCRRAERNRRCLSTIIPTE